jgi:hypothetical protein
MTSMTSRFSNFCRVLLIVTVLAPSYPASEAHAVRWSPRLELKGLADLDARLHRPFGDVFEGKVNGQQVTIANCADYLADSREHFTVTGGEQASIVLHSDAVDCVALDALRYARPAAISYLADFHLNASALAHLSPLLAPAVSNEEIAKARTATESGESWQQFVPSAHAKLANQPGTMDVNQPNWETTITEYGRGDFTGDGLEDLLVRADYAATKGTYRNTRLFLLSRKTASGVLSVAKEYTIP